VLDLGAGTGSVAALAAGRVAPGRVIAVDPSVEMLDLARRRIATLGLTNIDFREGRGEEIPLDDGSIDVLLASLSLMFAIDRSAVARECARVLRPGGRVVAAVWGRPEECDIVRFQTIAGSFAPTPPVPGVGPGALAEPAAFLAQLERQGIHCAVDTAVIGFDFEDFDNAWNVLAAVTAAHLPPDREQEARHAAFTQMWPDGDGPRHFDNLVLFLTGYRQSAR
jgi:SAM-dependent methyltransferase